MSKSRILLAFVENARNPSPCLAAGLRQQSTAAASASAVSSEVTADLEWKNARPFEEIPGPRALPLIGTAHKFIPKIGEFSGGDLYNMIVILYNKYGKIWKLRAPNGMNMVGVYDPDWVEKVLRNEGPWPIRDSSKSLLYYRKVTRKDFFQGNAGLILEQGEAWQAFRSKVNQPMMQPKTTKLYVGPINDVADDFIDRVYELRDSKMEMPENFLNELFKWSLESIAMVALDARLGCLDKDLKPDSEPQRMIDCVQVVLDSMMKLDFQLPIWRYISTPMWRKYASAMDYFNEVASRHIYTAMDKLKNKPVDSDEEMTLLERFLARDSTSKTAIIMALDMLMAGIDTTSVTTANTLYHLAVNPEKQELLYKDIVKISPSRNSNISGENLEGMKYLKACVRETMRLTPVALGNGRTMVNDIVIGNYRIPKGTMVVLPHMQLSRMEEHFPQAKSFIPERWLKSKGSEGGCPVNAEKTHPFVSLPFGFGPRMCIGRRFAELEVMTIIAKMMQHFRVEYHYGEMTYVQKTLVAPSKPLKFRFIERN